MSNDPKIEQVSCCNNCLLLDGNYRCEKFGFECDADQICQWYEPDPEAMWPEHGDG